MRLLRDKLPKVCRIFFLLCLIEEIFPVGQALIGQALIGQALIGQALIGQALAGTTGTLAGYVRDKDTGLPLIGASIIVEGTTLGAMAGKDGFYILNVPAGTYTVRAEMMGYATVRKTQVTIIMDLRTTVNFELSQKILDLGKEVVVTAERPLIQRDVTSTMHVIEGKMLNRLPVDNFRQAVRIQPGIVLGHFRGGRIGEVLYMVDGLPIQEAITREVGTELPNNSIIEMTVQTGGFTAEYGNAMSGVVNVITKEGGRSPHLFYQNRGDFYLHEISRPLSPQNPPMQRLADFNRYFHQEIDLGGPLWSFGNYFLSANHIATDTRFREAMRAFFPSPIFQNVNLNTKASFQLNRSFKLTLQGLYSYWRWHEYEHRWRYNLGGLPLYKKVSHRINARLTHVLSPTAFYTISLSRYVVRKRIEPKGPREFHEPRFYKNDRRSWILEGYKQWWQDSREIIAILKADLVNQISSSHQIKAGLEFTYYDLDLYDFKYELTPIDTSRHLYGFSPYRNSYRYFPKAGAAYIQDKIEYQGFVANLGVRFDFLDPTARRPAIELPPVRVEEKYYRKLPEVKASLKAQLSPRIGLAFPLTERDALHVNYGWFFQMPTFEYLYTSLDNDLSAYWPLIGNPDLEPERTIAYELSYKRILSESWVMSITAFNKDIFNLVDTKTLALPDSTLQGTSERARRGFAEYVNLAYGHIRGLEVLFEKRFSGWFSASLSYTLMKATGSSSSAGQGYNWMVWGIPVPLHREYPLSWDQRHTFILNADIRKPQHWGINVLIRLNSPLPYTAVNSRSPNNLRMGWRNYVDLKANRDFSLGKGVQLTLYLEILNLLDARNILWVDGWGRPGGHLADPSAYDEGRRIRLGFSIKL